MQRFSLTGKHWRLSPAAPDHPLNTEEVFALLCNQRDIDPGATLKLTSPLAFDDMPRAVERIRRAIDDNERIGIFGDYDCDGITAVAMLVRFFRRNKIEPHVRLPHRVRDGYGLNQSIVQEMREQGIQLLITADTGIASVEEITALQKAGIDVIITDHHRVMAEVPPAFAILHPTLSTKCRVPYPSGAGVVLQLIRALEGADYPGVATDWALAALGTVADLVELRGDNRTIVHHGLRALNTSVLEGGLPSLIETVRSSDAPLTSMDIGFRIAPRINAAGRMEDPTIALNALLNGGEAIGAIDRLNADRQQKTAQYMEEALATFQTSAVPPFLFLADARYPHGLLGLIAGRLTEAFGRPSMVATIENGLCTASLRSPSCYNITEGLQRSAHLLKRYGGHAQAAGCTFAEDALEALSASLTMDVLSMVSAEELNPAIDVDATLSPEHLTLDLYEKIIALQPFGQGNTEPRFIIENATLAMPRRVGADSSHLQTKIAGRKAIGFGLGHMLQHATQPLDAVVRLGVDTWQGSRGLQLFIEDVRIAKTAPVSF